jgi:hypothetical protein
VTQTVQEWAARAATLPAALVEATPRAVVASARILDEQATTNLRVATGGDLKLSRVRSGKGATIALRVRTAGSGSRTRAEVVPTGPIMLIEADTRRHTSPRQSLAQRTGGARSYSMARRRSASRTGYLNIPGVGFRANANHPGTKGKRPVRRAFQQSGDEAGRAGVLIFSETVRRHLSG